MAVMQNAELRAFEKRLHQDEFIFERRKKGVALHRPVDQGEIKIGTERQGLSVDLGSAANKQIPSVPFRRVGIDLGEVGYRLDTGNGLTRAAHDDGGAL